jgi:hypothetical protein
MSIVQLFPDAEAMDRPMIGVDELARKARELMESVSLEIYGAPSDRVLEMMRQIVGAGVTLNLRPDRVGGYIRIWPAQGTSGSSRAFQVLQTLASSGSLRRRPRAHCRSRC